jgi:LemA protein
MELLPLIIIAIVLLIPIIWVIAIYNRFARLRQHLKESWHNIDIEMKRRYELIPNLVATVKGYAAHERETLEQVTQLRNKAMHNHGSAASQAVDESALMLCVKKLFAVVENYPQLRADANFLALQKELSLTEDRIAAARRFFNANTREMNQMCQTVPTNIVGKLLGFSSGSFFELDDAAERVVPTVTL